jgi:N-acetyl-anhydromuramyl-L-alanine amidase AmpD
VEIYELTDFNPKGTNRVKKQIILTETGRSYKNYINSLKYRYNKKNPYLPHFVITKKGEVYKILKENEYSSFMYDNEVNKKSIIISLENYGWLKKIPIEEKYINWIGDIYNKKVFEKNWRGQNFWDEYENKQIEVLSDLIKKLCNDLNIPKECLGHNVKYDGVEHFSGIVSRSNYEFEYKDINPSFNFKLLKKLLEND